MPPPVIHYNFPDYAQIFYTDLSVLNQFISWVKTTALPPTTRHDAIKILETLRWIKSNYGNIKQFIANKDIFLPTLPPRDQANGVIRDHKGTSIHFNFYENSVAGADAAVSDLSHIVMAFEHCFTLWKDDKPLALLAFIAKFNYDKDIGCMEARVAVPMSFAGTLQATDGVVPLTDLIQTCQLQ